MAQIPNSLVLAPHEGDQCAAYAGSILKGKSLILGAGRCIAAKVYMLHQKRPDLTIVDNNEYFRQFVPIGTTFIYQDVENFDPVYGYECLYFDIFPTIQSPCLEKIANSIVEAGQLMFIHPLYRPDHFGKEWKVVSEVHPNPWINLSVIVCRREHII